MAIDSQDRPVIAGEAGPDWPLTTDAYQFGQFTSSGVVFITRLTSDGTALDFSAKIDAVDDTGGSLIVEAVAVTPDDRPVLVGWTTGAGFPVPSTAYQPLHSGGSGTEAIAVILSENGSQLVGGTWLGRSITSDRARAVTVNELGQVFLGAEAFGPARLFHFNADMSQILSDPVGVASTGSISMLRTDQNQPVAIVSTLSGEGSPGAFQESHPGGNQATPFITRWSFPVDDPQGVTLDLSDDAVVNATDLAALIAGWGECEDIGVCVGDLNADGIVNAGDLAVMIASWGSIKSEQ
jgi:hypothetical protein